MKRKFIIRLITIMLGTPLVGQTTSGGGHIENNQRLTNLLNTMSTSSNALADTGRLNVEQIEGSMYYNEAFVEGQIYYEAKTMAKASMRYNAYTDQIEIKRPGKPQSEALLQDSKVSGNINGERYYYLEYANKKGDLVQGYLVSTWKGKNYHMYERRSKAFKAGQVQKTSMHLPTPDKFVDRNAFYVSKSGETPVYMNTSKKGIALLFGKENEKEIKSYIKKNRLDLSMKRDLTYLLLYADSMAAE